MKFIETEIDLDFGDMGLRTVTVHAEVSRNFDSSIPIEVKRVLFGLPLGDGQQHVNIVSMIRPKAMDAIKTRLRTIYLSQLLSGREASGEVVA